VRVTIQGFTLGIIVALSLSATLAIAQVAPTGGHYAARPSDTGFAGLVNSSGGFSQSVPLNLAPAKGGLPVPVQIVYGGARSVLPAWAGIYRSRTSCETSPTASAAQTRLVRTAVRPRPPHTRARRAFDGARAEG